MEVETKMYVASACTTVKFHELPSGTVVHNYQPGTQVDGPIRSISWSKDGNWLALVPFSGQVEIVSVKEQLKLIHTIHGIEEPSCASFQNTTKKNIAVGTKNGQVLIYDIKGRSVKKRFPATTSMITHVEFTAKDNHIVSASADGEAQIYNNITNSLAGRFTIPKSSTINAMRTNSIKRNYVVAGSNEGVVAVWDIHANKNRFALTSHKAPVTSVVFSPINSDLVASSGLDRQFCFYDVASGKCVKAVAVPEHNVISLDFSPDGKYIVMASQRGKIYVFDSRNVDNPIHSFAAHNGSVKHVSFRKTEDMDSSMYSLTFETMKDEVKDKHISIPEAIGDSFKLHLVASSGDAGLSPEGDSFMAAMGLDKSDSMSQLDSVKVTESMRKMQGCLPSPNLVKINEHETQFSSTPNVVAQELSVPFSPICQPNATTPDGCMLKAATGDLDNMIRGIVKEELRNMYGNLKEDMKYHSTHIATQNRQLILDLLMQMVKESIKVEKNFNSLREDLFVAQNPDALIEENAALRQRLAELEELQAQTNKRF